MKIILLVISLVLVPIGIIQAQAQNNNAGSYFPVSTHCIELKNNMSYLARDSKINGNQVSVLQDFLNRRGFLGSLPTGFFGPATFRAVKGYQSLVGLPSTGFVGPATRSMIKSETCRVLPMNVSIISTSTTATSSSIINAQRKNASGLPKRIKIPAISVDATIGGVGLAPDGVMDSPIGPNDTGWYNLGSRPGEIGSAVIDGHSGWKNNIPAVFDNLHKLSKGDKIYVEDEKGMVVTFVVRENLIYDPKADASNVFGSNDGKAHLNLITCGGVWDKISRSSSERIIVFADKE